MFETEFQARTPEGGWERTADTLDFWETSELKKEVLQIWMSEISFF
jgi:hypothetical protein